MQVARIYRKIIELGQEKKLLSTQILLLLRTESSTPIQCLKHCAPVRHDDNFSFLRAG